MRDLPFSLRAFYLTPVKRVKVGAALGDKRAPANRASGEINAQDRYLALSAAGLTNGHTASIFGFAYQCPTSADNRRQKLTNSHYQLALLG
jgi:hypothetical protein